ncbi:unnamed protein product [Ceutorhynchus assimilis]|uniref:Uncharacterized protein n=1 Tax=Ceutorhynchus assimilis TaxID=467358 RepID=A0A9N9MTB1_9CUCU|nr:unnamed protein product [Ceutorhynchus assimilis]
MPVYAWDLCHLREGEKRDTKSARDKITTEQKRDKTNARWTKRDWIEARGTKARGTKAHDCAKTRLDKSARSKSASDKARGDKSATEQKRNWIKRDWPRTRSALLRELKIVFQNTRYFRWLRFKRTIFKIATSKRRHIVKAIYQNSDIWNSDIQNNDI